MDYRFPFQREEEHIPSPCIGVCQMEGAYCAGCKRTVDEIARWRAMTNRQKKEVLAELEVRHRFEQESTAKKRKNPPE
ncbi:DUF1289 domain-containing protein [bacterium]|nr:DUF1289 domain-containing protein [bacterium]